MSTWTSWVGLSYVLHLLLLLFCHPPHHLPPLFPTLVRSAECGRNHSPSSSSLAVLGTTAHARSVVKSQRWNGRVWWTLADQVFSSLQSYLKRHSVATFPDIVLAINEAYKSPSTRPIVVLVEVSVR